MYCRVCGSLITDFTELNVPISGMTLFDYCCHDDSVNTALYRCPQCGHGQIPNSLPQNYYRHYKVLTVQEKDCTSDYYNESLLSFFKNQILDIVNSLFFEKKNRALDIGCADGSVSKILEDSFDFVDGVEPSNNYIGCFKGNGDLYSDYLENISFKNHYNFIFCADLLEHIDNLKGFVQKMYSIMDDNAYALIMTPNGSKILNEGNWYDVVAEHLNYFTSSSICHLFSDLGFEICNFSLIRDQWWIRLVLKKNQIKQLVQNKMGEDLKKLQLLLSSEKTVSFWGAGVKGKCLLTSLSKKIRYKYIFDSNPIKYGKYFSGVNECITAPDETKVLSNDIIIISALENKAVIINALRKVYNFKGEIRALDNLDELL